MATTTFTDSKHYINLRSGYMAPVTLHCSYGDSGETVYFYVFDGGTEFDLTNAIVSVHGTRIDGANFGPFACSISGNKVSFKLQSSMTAVEGSAIAEFVIAKNGVTIGTCNFGILVENATFPNGVTYDTDPSVYQDILSYLQGSMSALKAETTTNLSQEISARQKGDSTLDAALDVERARIDEIISGGTSESDSEVIDIRIGSDGQTYASAGAAVRYQISNISDATDSISTVLIDNSSSTGTAAATSTSRWFVNEALPPYSKITELKYYCASTCSGTILIELWEKDGDTLTRVYSKSVTPSASTINSASIDYVTTKTCYVSFKPSATSLRYDGTSSNDYNRTLSTTNTTATTLTYSTIMGTNGFNFRLCVTIRYILSLNTLASKVSSNYHNFTLVNYASSTGTSGPTADIRYFPYETIPGGTFVKTIKFYAASAAEGNVTIELFSKNGSRSSWGRVYQKIVPSRPSSINECTINFLTTSETLVSFKSSSTTGFRFANGVTGSKMYVFRDNYDSFNYSSLETFNNFKLCVDIDCVRIPSLGSKHFIVDAGGRGDYTSFSEALIDVYNNYPGSTIAVNPGTYNVYDELIAIMGSTYWDELTSSKDYASGLPFGNGMTIVGSPGAVITFDGSSTTNTNAHQLFSILMGRYASTQTKINTVEGLTFNVTNGRYCIHLDEGNIPNDYTYVIKDCKFYIDNSSNTSFTLSDAIGMGSSVNTTYAIENCYIYPTFNSEARDNEAIYYHITSNATAQNNKLIVSNNYIDNGGTIRVDLGATGTGECMVQINNNSLATAIIDNATSSIAKRAIWANDIRG